MTVIVDTLSEHLTPLYMQPRKWGARKLCEYIDSKNKVTIFTHF